MYQGRIFVEFELIPLSLCRPDEGASAPRPGVLSLLLGKLSSNYECRPTCHVELNQMDNTVVSQRSLEAFYNSMEWTFNEGKLFRVNDVNHKSAMLTIKIRDEMRSQWIGAKEFKLRDLVDRPTSREISFPNPFNTKTPVTMFIHISVYVDGQK